jgi:hypothetical protein
MAIGGQIGGFKRLGESGETPGSGRGLGLVKSRVVVMSEVF